MLISTHQLSSILTDPNLILIDARSYKDYLQGHIPGAVNLDLFSFHWIDTSKRGLESFNEQSQRILSIVGVSKEKKVVFYDDISGMLAARGVWLLSYFSHNQVFMLDGGITKWKKDNYQIETTTNGFVPSQFKVQPNPNVIADFQYIKENLNSLHIIDARSPDEYNGTSIRAARVGHIPNSINIDWNQNVAEDGTIKNDDELLKLYLFPKNSEIIAYCHGAYRASHTFLVLKKLGFQKVKVYLGSWAEWGNKIDLPVA